MGASDLQILQQRADGTWIWVPISYLPQGLIRYDSAGNPLCSNTVVISGVTDGSNAGAGVIGQFMSSLVAIGSAVSLSTTVASNITSLTLTAGDWDVSGSVNYTYSAATISQKTAGISGASATLPSDGSESYSGAVVTLSTSSDGISIPKIRSSSASPVTVYLVGRATFSAGTVAGFGSLFARRVR